MPVTFSNAGRAALSVTIEVSDQFTSSEHELTLEGGEARDVSFTFTPTREGEARLELEGFTLALHGVGLPACVASTCRTSVFDLTSRSCVETALEDGAACEAACLSGAGTCLQGNCVGTATSSCDDQNLCTIDGCGADGGCIHVPATAPTRSACEVAVCDPQRGFEYQNVEDGTLCGEPTCNFARVCLNGSCAQRPTANAPDDCKYTHVCTASVGSGRTYACASTRSGKLRCWGDPELLERDGGSSLPEFFPGVTDAQKAVCIRGGAGWLDSARHLQPTNPIASGGFTEFVDVRGDRLSLNNPRAFRALTPDGVYLRSLVGFDTNVVVDGGVERLCSVEYFIRDGGWLFDTNTPDVQKFTKPVRSCGHPINSAFAFDDGSAVNGQNVELADGGVTLVGAANGPTLFFGAQTKNVFPSLRPGPTWPFVPIQVTEEHGELCGVSATGELACMAAIDGTRLAMRPDLPIEVGDGGFTWIRADSSFVMREAVMLIDRTGHLFATDGRYTADIKDAGSSTLVPTGGAFTDPVTSASRTCLVHGTTMRCFHDFGRIVDVADVVSTSDDGNRSTGVTIRGELVDDEGVVLKTGVLPGSNRYSQALTDGGIANGANTFAPLGPFRADTFHEGGGCFVTPQLEAWCFWGGIAPQRMNLPFGVRLVSGNTNRGCAVIGNNGVRCWGLGARFKNVALEGLLTQISVNQNQNDLIACALTDKGRVFCWGNNDYGGLGIAPYDGTFIVPLE